MAEELGALRISLGINDVNFTRSVSDINRRLRVVDSEFRAASAGVDNFGSTLDQMRFQSDNLSRKLQLQRDRVSELRRSYEQAKATKGEDAAETQRLAAQYNNALGSMRRTESMLNQVNQSIGEQTNIFRRAQRAMTDFGSRTSELGRSLTATLTPAIGALGLGLGKIANDADASSARIQRTLGLTKEEAKELTGTARDLWKNGFGEGMEDVETALLSVKQNMKGLGEKDLKEATKNAIYLAETFDADVNEVTRAGQNLMKGFGISSEKAFDLMAWGGQKGLNFSQEMFDNLSEYSPLFAKMGFSAEEYFQLLEKGSQAGVYNLDYINDAMKEFQIRMKDGSKSTSDAMDEMSKGTQKVWKEFQDGKKTIKDVHNTVIKELQSMEDQTEANILGAALYGTKWEDLEADAMYAMGEIGGGLEDLDGAMKKSGDGVERTFGERAKMAWRQAQDALLPLGEALLDVAEDILPPLQESIEWVTDKFKDMSPEMKNATLIVGGLGMVIPPIIIAFGGIASAIGGLMPLIGSLSAGIAGAGGLGAVLTALTGPIGLTVAAIAGLGIGFMKLDEHMDKPILKADIFKGEISEATKEAVGSYMKLNADATAELNNLALSQATITEEMATDMVTKYQTMGDQVLNAMKENHSKQLEEQQRLFDESNILSEEEEAKRIAKLKADQLKEIEAHNEKEARIKEIWLTASHEKRGITDEEAKEIAKLQEEMKVKAIEELSASQEEQIAILDNLKSEKEVIEAETAANTVKKATETKNKVVEEAEKQFEETVASAEAGRDELGTISAKEADDIIKEAERKRDETVSKAQDMHYDIVEEAKKQAGEHVSEVNWETGEVLSGWDAMYNGVLDAVNWIRGLFGKDALAKKGSVKETKRQTQRRQNAQLKAYKDGTTNGTHPGGMALVGEEGYELAHIPGQGVTLLGAAGQEIVDLPRGSSVLPHRHTQDLLKKYNFPMYAEGIGDYFDVFLKGSGAAWDLVKEKFSLKDSLIPSWISNHIGSPLKWVGDMAKTWIKDLFDGMFSFDAGSFSGGGAEMAKQAIMQALQITGKPISWLSPMMTIAQRESGFNPKAINLWDINAKRGIPSKGMFQTIDPTFNAYKMPGMNDIWNPVHNAIAAIRYMDSRYGGVFGHPGVKNMAKGGGYLPYANGGFINGQQLALMGEEGPEVVIPLMSNRRNRALELWEKTGELLGAYGSTETASTSAAGSSGDIHINFYGDNVISNDMDIDYIANEIGNKVKSRLYVQGVKR